MYDPDQHRGPGFGSELQRRQTPELARRRRRRGIFASLLGILIGAAMLVVGIDATRTGELVRGFPGQLALSGPEAVALGLVVVLASGWSLWRCLRGVDSTVL